MSYLFLWMSCSDTFVLACWGHRHRTSYLSGRGCIVHKPLHSEIPGCAGLSLPWSLLLTEGDTTKHGNVCERCSKRGIHKTLLK